MKCNVGKTDKILRVVLALLIGAAGFYFKSYWGLIGLVPLLTAFAGICPAYMPFGLSTCKKQASEK